MASLTAIELKFLLRLLEEKNHRSQIVDIKPNDKTPAAQRDRICKALAAKGLVDYSSEVSRFTISRFGKVLLSLDTTSLLVTPDELKLLRNCKGATSPGQLSLKIPASARQQIIHSLAARKLVKIFSVEIKEVWLTEKGKNVLRDKYKHVYGSDTYQTSADAV